MPLVPAKYLVDAMGVEPMFRPNLTTYPSCCTHHQIVFPISHSFHQGYLTASTSCCGGRDSNPRPLGYEPSELPSALPRDESRLSGCQASFRFVIPWTWTLYECLYAPMRVPTITLTASAETMGGAGRAYGLQKKRCG